MREKFCTFLFITVATFGYLQWFFAEQDNEILRKELSTYTNKEIFK